MTKDKDSIRAGGLTPDILKKYNLAPRILTEGPYFLKMRYIPIEN